MSTTSTITASQNRLYFRIFPLLAAIGILYFTLVVLLLDLITADWFSVRLGEK